MRRIWEVEGLTLLSLGLVFVVCCIPAAPVGAEIRAVARRYEISPGYTNPFQQFGKPVLNDAGQVGFGAKAGLHPSYPKSVVIRADSDGLEAMAWLNMPFSVGGADVLVDETSLAVNLNESGLMSFSVVTGNPSIETHVVADGATLTPMFYEGQSSPYGDGVIYAMGPDGPMLSDSGKLAARVMANPSGWYEMIVRSDGATLDGIVRGYQASQAPPDEDGVFDSLSNQVGFDGSDNMYFWAYLTGTTRPRGFFRSDGTAITRMVRSGEAIPDGPGAFNLIGGSLLGNVNNSGQQVFWATMTGTAGGSTDDYGVYVTDGTTITPVLREGFVGPSGKLASYFGETLINNAGQVAVRGSYSIGGNSGYFWDGSEVTEFLYSGLPAPDGNGVMNYADTFSLNDRGHVVFSAMFTGTDGGSNDDKGIYIADGEDLIKVARKGDGLDGEVIIDLRIAAGSNTNSSACPINNSGQVAFTAFLSGDAQSSGVYLFTPELHWRSPTGGDWTDEDRWTLRMTPQPFNNAHIDPDDGLTVVGPAGALAVKSLTIGALTSGLAELQIQPGSTLTATEGVTIGLRGKLSGQGTVPSRIGGEGAIEAVGGTLTLGDGGDSSRLTFTGTLAADAGATLHLNYGTPASLAANVNLSGGSLPAPAGVVLAPGAVLSGHGEVQADLLNNGSVLADGGTLTFAGEFRSEDAPVGGTAIAIAATGSFVGRGLVDCEFTSLTGSQTILTGDLAVGNAVSTDGVDVSGSLAVGLHTLTLQDADQAQLHGETTIDGGLVTAPGGIRNTGRVLMRAAGSRISGGTFTNEGLLRVTDGVGHEIAASLSNASGADVEAFEDVLFSGPSNFNAGRISAVGTAVVFQQAVVNDSGGQINAINATLQFDGGLTNSGELNLIHSTVIGDVQAAGGPPAVEGIVTFAGDVSGNAVFTGAGQAVFTAGVNPGVNPGVMSFEGDVAFGSGATLTIELGGLTPGDEHDQLVVGGELTPGGTLQISLIDDLVPNTGDIFDIFDFASASPASFDTIDLPELTGRKAWDTSNLYTTGEVSVIAMLIGDTDTDWDVDVVDYIAFMNTFGATGGWPTDFDEDGRVDLTDFAMLRGNFGSGVGSAPDSESGPTIPEPATLILMAGGLPVLLRLRRRGQY